MLKGKIQFAVSLALSGLLCVTAGCEDRTPNIANPAEVTNAAPKVFAVRGVIREFLPNGTTISITHEEIPGYMPAMTMPLSVIDPKELAGFKTNDTITFRLIVTEDDSWMENLKRVEAPPPTELPSRSTVRIVRDVEPLEEGDMLPEYRFTNTLNRAISTADFKGDALAFTFIFTRCPLPQYCPLMSINFARAQEKLKTMSGAPTNWHLLSISFDTEFDTPEVLRGYALAYKPDPKHWSFVTGALIDITALGEQFGLTFWRADGTINHNLRTVVVDATGRIQKIFIGNEWTSGELVEEIVKAAKAQPATAEAK